MMLNNLLSQAAAADPAREALVGLDSRLTWEQFEHVTACVATGLREAGLAPGERVGIACLKDTQSYVAAHGILRAGGVVVPIDPMAPPLAAREVLAHAQVSALIGDARTIGPLEAWSVSEVDLRCVMVAGDIGDSRATDWQDVVDGDVSRFDPGTRPDDPAYLIYTSGSTGRPKGIVHTHASALAYAERAVSAHGLTSLDRVAGIAPFHFDQATFELYAAPLARAAVVVMGEPHIRFPASFTERSEAEQVTVWYSVPSLFQQVNDRGAVCDRDLSDLRLILYGGEPYPGGDLAALMAALPRASVTNVYGPAEVNECTNHPVRGLSVDGGDISIGRPWDGVEVLVVDESGQSVGVGEPGELWVSAPTVMQGYWRDPDLTAAAMTSRADGPPWYATGDVVVADREGQLWFKGRRDNQVKVRGVRLELEAVESVVADAPGVGHAVVGPAGPPGEASHLAAVVSRVDDTFDPSIVRRWCAEKLTPIAVPRTIEVRDDFPLTASGKIDRARIRRELIPGVGS